MNTLRGKIVLVVEDEAVIGLMVVDMLESLGATIIGPIATVGEAMEIAESTTIDAAVLDVNLRGTKVDPLAEALRRRGVPFVVATGYALQGYDAPQIAKPYTKEKLEAALIQAIGKPSGQDC